MYRRGLPQMAPFGYRTGTAKGCESYSAGHAGNWRRAHLAGGSRHPRRRLAESRPAPSAGGELTRGPRWQHRQLSRVEVEALASRRWNPRTAAPDSYWLGTKEAAQQLGVTRPTIYRWMDDRTLNYVRDDMSGRTFVVRRDIDNLKRVAAELSAQG